MRYISRFKNSIRASSIYSLAFILTFALAGSLMSVEEAEAQRTITLSVDRDTGTEGDQNTVTEGETYDGTTLESGITFTLTATRTGVNAADTVTVKLPADDADNFAITQSGTIIEGTGDARTLKILFPENSLQDLMSTATFTLSATDDGIFEAPHKITFTGTALNNVFVVSTAITLNDDDHELELMASETEIAEDGGKKKVTVTATLTKGTRATNINIPVTVSTSRFYTLSENSFNIEIEAQETMGTGSFEITPANNVTYDGSQKITIDVGTTTLAFKGPVTIALNDDEKLPDLKLSASPDKISEGGGGRRVTVTASLEGGVTLSTSTRVAVSITPNSGEYGLSANAMSITIPANRTSGTGRVTITPVNDPAYEPPMDIDISASATLVADDSGSKRSASTKVTLVDDDHTVTLSASPSTIKDADAETTGSQPTEVTVTATLTSPAAVEETVLVTVPDATGNPRRVHRWQRY